MTEKQAKHRGFVLVAIVSAFHIVFINGLLMNAAINWDDRGEYGLIFAYFGISLVSGLVLSWRLGRSYGVEVFINQQRDFKTHYVFLFTIMNIVNTVFIIAYSIYEAIVTYDVYALGSNFIGILVSLFLTSLICVFTAIILYALASIFY